ncbi:MAG: hypothetical protein EHM42_01625, partial [Planctomycetaceae bacterium]
MTFRIERLIPAVPSHRAEPRISRREALASLGALAASPLLTAGAVAAPVIGSESWPTFRNGNSQRGLASTSLPATLEQLWAVDSGPKDAMVTATAAIVGEHVYAASLNGEVFCLDRLTGRRLWTYRSREEPDTSKFIPGFKAAVAVSGEGVFLGDEEGLFHAIDRDTGKKKWQFSTNPDDPTGNSAPIVSCASFFEDKLLFGSHDNNLYCLNVGDGSLAWKFATEGMVNCSPAIVADHTFVTGCDSHLRVINVHSGKQVTDMPLGIYLVASPAVVDNLLYVGTHGGEVLAIDWKAAKTVWTYEAKQGDVAFHSSAAVNDRFVIVGGQDKKLHCLHRDTGKLAWIFNARRQIDSSPVIVGDRVFVGSHDGKLYGLELET